MKFFTVEVCSCLCNKESEREAEQEFTSNSIDKVINDKKVFGLDTRIIININVVIATKVLQKILPEWCCRLQQQIRSSTGKIFVIRLAVLCPPDIVASVRCDRLTDASLENIPDFI